MHVSLLWYLKITSISQVLFSVWTYYISFDTALYLLILKLMQQEKETQVQCSLLILAIFDKRELQ